MDNPTAARTAFRSRVGSAALALLAMAGVVVAAGPPARATERLKASRIVVSGDADRSGSRTLAGRTLRGDAYIWVRGSGRSASFWLNGRPGRDRSDQVETNPPFDLGGGSATGPRPLDTRLLTPGVQRLVVRIRRADGVVLHRAVRFTVAGARTGRPVPAPTVPPAPTPPPAAFPDASTTGVPPGTPLTPSGSIRVTKPGTVLSNLDIDGCVDVLADNVVIRNSVIRCSRATTAIRTMAPGEGAGNLIVEDVDIDGLGTVSAAVGFSNYTLRRVDIRNCLDGPRLSSNTVVEDSFIHDMKRTDVSHNDSLQTTGAENVVVRGNTLLSYNASTDDPQNAAMMLGTTTSPLLRNFLVEGNYMDGGNYTINIRPDVKGVSNVVFRGNVFGRNFRYGPVTRVDLPGITFDATNVWFDTGAPVS